MSYLGKVKTSSSKDECSTGSNNHLKGLQIVHRSLSSIGQKILLILPPVPPPSPLPLPHTPLFQSRYFIGDCLDVSWDLFIIFLCYYLFAVCVYLSFFQVYLKEFIFLNLSSLNWVDSFRALVAGTWSETKLICHGGFVFTLAHDNV